MDSQNHACSIIAPASSPRRWALCPCRREFIRQASKPPSIRSFVLAARPFQPPSSLLFAPLMVPNVPPRFPCPLPSVSFLILVCFLHCCYKYNCLSTLSTILTWSRRSESALHLPAATHLSSSLKHPCSLCVLCALSVNVFAPASATRRGGCHPPLPCLR